MRYTFTHLPAQLNYPAKVRSKLSAQHSAVIQAAVYEFPGTYRAKVQYVDILNLLSYYMLTNSDLTDVWDGWHPLEFKCEEKPDDLEDVLKDLYLTVSDIEWDIEAHISDSTSSAPAVEPIVNPHAVRPTPVSATSEPPTPKSDLYLGGPIFPEFDVNKPWIQATVRNEVYTIYTSLPEIPTTQSEITVTTDETKLTDSDRMKLFPNCVIPTRAAVFYDHMNNMPYDDDLGLIFPIADFTEAEIRDNIIKYPHLHNLIKYIDGEAKPFYSALEINGELYDICKREVWESIPDLSLLPFNVDFLKEYVIRRYILERDLRGVQHKYPMFGSFEPFITMFMPANNYARRGYDPHDVADACVTNRIAYLRTRNPIIRKIYGADAI